jgi:hypothetical protein
MADVSNENVMTKKSTKKSKLGFRRRRAGNNRVAEV